MSELPFRQRRAAARLVPAFALLAACVQARAASELPKWELGIGAGTLSFPPWTGSTHHNDYLSPVPYVVYRGERLQADRGGIRTLLFDTERLSLRLSVSATPPPDDGDDAARDGMPGLDPVLEAGPELRWRLWQGEASRRHLNLRLPLRLAYAASTDGIESIGATFFPSLSFELHDLPAAGWKASVSAGPLFATDEYHEYYYEVEARHATVERPAYAAQGGFGGTMLMASLSRRRDRLWIGGFLRAQSLAGAEIEDSPLVHTRSGMAAGVAFAWIFARSSSAATIDIDD